MSWLRLGLCSVVLAAFGCGPTSASEIRSQAVRDFQCPESQIKVEHVGPTTIEVRGCGKSALYICEEGATIRPRDVHTNPITEEEARYQGGSSPTCRRVTPQK